MNKFAIRIIVGLIAASFFATAISAQNTPKEQKDQIMVLPFENLSKDGNFNWVGESLADSLTDLLNVQIVNVISNQERKFIQQRLGMSANVLPSLAASLKIARESNATLLVSGMYSITPEQDKTAASVTVRARVIRVNEGTFLSETTESGQKINREIVLTDALANLQTIEGQLAFQILNQRDNALPFTLNEFIDNANKVPAKAFEAYIKGLLASANDPATKANYFINAIRIYEDQKNGATYVDAALELGYLYLTTGKSANAIAYFARVPSDAQNYAEAAFYTGLIHWQQGDYEQSLAVLRPLAEDLKLTNVYNALGAIATSAARDEKDPAKSSAFLMEGLDFLKKAAESTNDKMDVYFNYGFALFLKGNYMEAAERLRPVLASNPKDGEAYYLLSKTLEKLGDQSAKDFDNQARKYLTDNNKYALLENQWKTGKLDLVKMRVVQPSRREFMATILLKDRNQPTNDYSQDETTVLLNQAQALYDQGKDDEALIIARRILVSELTKAETYLLLAKILLRQGDTEQAISNLKAANFWNNKLVEAHVLLGRVYIQKRDCQQAKTYLDSAKAVDPDNEGTKSLERLVERCSK